jgi:hypothetical protein
METWAREAFPVKQVYIFLLSTNSGVVLEKIIIKYGDTHNGITISLSYATMKLQNQFGE